MKLLAGLILGLTLSSTAYADVAPFARVEATAAFPLRPPQTTYFYPGFNGALEGGLNFGWVDAKITAMLLTLPVRPAVAGDTSVSGAFGGGVRFKLPYDMFTLSPWIDVDALYDRSATLNRFAYSLAIGLHIPVTSQPTLRLGPVIRFIQIIDTSETRYDDRNAYLLNVGLSVEMDHFTADKLESETPPTVAYVAAAPPPASAAQPIDVPAPEPVAASAPEPQPAASAPAGEAVSVAAPASVPVSPAAVDSDGDGIPDDEDACPHDAGSKHTGAHVNGCPAAFIRDGKIVLSEHITFASGKADIIEDDATKGLLKGLLDILQSHPDIKHLLIVGYTDSHGARSKNLSLSKARASALVAWLVTSGVDKSRLQSDGKGSDKPIASNDAPEGRTENRRVEFEIKAE